MMQTIAKPISFGHQERFSTRYIEREAHLIIKYVKGEKFTTLPCALTEMDKRIMRYWGIK